jgi:hypothetical protein
MTNPPFTQGEADLLASASGQSPEGVQSIGQGMTSGAIAFLKALAAYIATHPG